VSAVSTDDGRVREAADEWATLIATAVVGTDRHPLPPAAAGWDVWGAGADPAVALLHRAAAVVAARRAGVLADAPLPPPPTAPHDHRRPCSAAALMRLQRLLRGEHELLLPEWLHRCGAAGLRPPWVLLPALLLRGRRHPELDALVRDVAGARARWLAEQVPELGVRPVPAVPTTGAVAPLRPPAPPADSGAAVSAIVETFVERVATWAAAPQLRLLVASLEPRWLPALVVDLSGLRFDVAVERTRADVLGLAEFRIAMLAELDVAASGAAPPGPAEGNACTMAPDE
jgi:hypothetical protein